jgi:hypothetical protein
MANFIPWDETYKRRKRIRFCYNAVFIKFPATADYYMGSRRTRESLGYPNILFSRKSRQPSFLFLSNMGNVLVKDAINHFSTHKFKVFF